MSIKEADCNYVVAFISVELLYFASGQVYAVFGSTVCVLNYKMKQVNWT